MNIPHCFVSLRYDCTLLLEEGGREGRGGMEIIAGVAVSEEMKEEAVRFGSAWSERGRKDREGGKLRRER